MSETMSTPEEISTRIREVASAEKLLVVSDFDGTLAEFATDIYAVEAHPEAVAALGNLAQLPGTTVAILSGRHLDGLRRVFPLGEPIIFGGSHGAESSDAPAALTPEMAAHLESIEERLREVCERYPGTSIEVKPFQRVFHTRQLAETDPMAAQEALSLVSAMEAGDYHKTVGKGVVEFSATAATKGTWITQRRELLGADAVVFVGDDTTDEEGFRALNQPTDLGVKVGTGETAATLRVDGVNGAAALFTQLEAARRTHR